MDDYTQFFSFQSIFFGIATCKDGHCDQKLNLRRTCIVLAAAYARLIMCPFGKYQCYL